MTLPVVFTANGQAGYNLTKSLRFRSSASAYLNRTFATPTSSTKWTWSGWFKLGYASTYYTIFDGGSPDTRFGRDPSTNQLYVNNDTTNFIITTPVYRDYSAWYHAVLAFDSSQGTASNRLRLYINGSEVTAFATDNRSSISGAIGINTATAHGIGRQPSGGSAYYDGYMTEINFIDGQQLTPSSFGETSTTTGVWIPKKYTGTYGTNGFYLPFTDTTSTSTLGTDFSGNSNTWTVNNISLTAGSTYDSMTDVPTLTDITTANYAVFNPLVGVTNTTLSNGNLTFTKTGNSDIVLPSTIAMPSGKFYWETTLTSVSASSNIGLGLIQQDAPSAATGTWPGASDAAIVLFGGNGNLYVNGTSSSGTGLSLATNDVVGLALDMSAATLAIYKNGSLVYTATSLVVTKPYFALFDSYGNGESQAVNFGQRPFAYTPPTGFVALNTFNLPTPTIGATASTTANKYMNISLYTGTGSSQSITGLGFQPDWTWIKGRSGATDHGLYDAVRGVQKQLESNNTDAETTETTGLTAFGSDGFTVGALAQLNTSSATYVAWNWKANGAGSTNTAGSITSTVSANTTAGFSIVTWTGSGSTATIGHGLGVAPSMIIWFHRTNASAYNHITYHASLPSAAYVVYLNLTIAQSSDNNAFNSTAPTSSVFTVGGYNSADTMVAYCFAQIAGYSAFGSYTGNGSTDGPFVYTGFRPRFVLVKESSAAGNNWVIYDTARDTYNECSKILYPNLANAEFDGSTVNLDILSNGFKPRDNWGGNNNSGNTYIYMAFAENPFKYANAR